MSNFEFKGTHYIASFKNCTIPENAKLTDLFQVAIQKSGATILNYTEHIFDNNAITFVFLLSESHCSIHTYPEHNSIFIDLFTCGDKINQQIFHDTIVDILDPKVISKQILLRD